MTADELRDSEDDANDVLYRHRQLTLDGMRIELELDIDSAALMIEGEGLAEEWVHGLRQRISAACGAECEGVERGR